MTEPALSSAEQLATARWLPTELWTSATKQRRQGDLCIGYYHQLCAGHKEDPEPASPASARLPVLSDREERAIELHGVELTVRVWYGWMMLVEHSCEIARKHPNDSRFLVAPVVFRSKWNGPHWNQIREGASSGMFFLPPIDEPTKRRFHANGWPAGSDAAVVLESTTCVSRKLVPGAVFGLTGQMRAALQAKLTDFLSTRVLAGPAVVGPEPDEDSSPAHP